MPNRVSGLTSVAIVVAGQDVLQWAPVKAALFAVLESPALQAVESFIDAVSTARSSLVQPAVPASLTRYPVVAPASV
jgi:hypothetical protein